VTDWAATQVFALLGLALAVAAKLVGSWPAIRSWWGF
jgi:hypothetical protein